MSNILDYHGLQVFFCARAIVDDNKGACHRQQYASRIGLFAERRAERPSLCKYALWAARYVLDRERDVRTARLNTTCAHTRAASGFESEAELIQDISNA